MRAPSALAGLCVLLFSVPDAHALTRQPVGSALVVVNLVTAEFNRDTRTLQSGDRVHQDETIEVGLDGSGELKLDDDTKLALGPGSHLTLDKFVYDPSKAKGSIVLDLVKGTFRFMTGVAEKPTYVIKTPAASITVRGTIFDVFVQDNGLSWLLLHEGAVQICNARGQCRDLTEPGKLIRISDDGDVGAPVRWASLPGKDNVSFDDAFPFVGKTPSIDPSPLLSRDVIILGHLPYPHEPKPPKPPTYEPKPTKPSKADRPSKERPKKAERPKKYEKKKRADKDGKKIIKGVGAAIGLGLAIGAAKNYGKHRPGGGGYGGGGGGYGGGRGGYSR